MTDQEKAYRARGSEDTQTKEKEMIVVVVKTTTQTKEKNTENSLEKYLGSVLDRFLHTTFKISWNILPKKLTIHSLFDYPLLY